MGNRRRGRRTGFFCENRYCDSRWRVFESHEAHPACAACGKPAARLKPVRASFLAHHVYATPDIPEHFNVSLGCAVRGRRHLRQIQHERGCSDYEPQRVRRDEVFIRGGEKVRVDRGIR